MRLRYTFIKTGIRKVFARRRHKALPNYPDTIVREGRSCGKEKYIVAKKGALGEPTVPRRQHPLCLPHSEYDHMDKNNLSNNKISRIHNTIVKMYSGRIAPFARVHQMSPSHLIHLNFVLFYKNACRREYQSRLYNTTAAFQAGKNLAETCIFIKKERLHQIIFLFLHTYFHFYN